jgi:NAD(P)H-dependent FMN reductase
MTSILAISGSLRKASYNTMLLNAAIEFKPSDMDVKVGSIHNVPIYNGDVEEQSGIPQSVKELKDTLAACQGLLLVTPEYNNSVPGVLKNAIDWMSRPSDDIKLIFKDKPVALLGASNGAGGTRFSQTAWLPVFRTLSMRPWFGGTLYMDRAQNVFDTNGKILDEKMKDRVKNFMEGFKAFIETQYRK